MYCRSRAVKGRTCVPRNRLNRYLVNRYYDPSTAQFLAVDPLVGATGQPFSYANDDPVNGSDPNGLAQPFRFSQEEQEAWDQCNAGNQEACDSSAYASAKQKAATNQKLGWAPNGSQKLPEGTPRRNEQKRQSNYFSLIPPCPLLQQLQQSIKTTTQSLQNALKPWGYAGDVIAVGAGFGLGIVLFAF